ncbi:nuclear transport factor 2 family protein [Bradyrhizobium sp. 2TAF24]|uniref:nuclear transport factor 2 family protein n=1 Tax=Bradyrhizobium sp. 2TAF24 TaxID=3233011 RepID=UPI003F8E35D9
MTANALADQAQRTLDGWHRFVASGDQADLAPLLSERIVFRSPVVHTPIPGKPATMLVLGAVVQIFQDFQYHRTFVAGAHDVALEFSAKVDRFDLKGLDLIRFDADGRMIEFEVLVRPFKALEALNAAMTARIGPELARLKQAGAPA